jgi:hypothetical protein
MNYEKRWTVYRTRFLVNARQLTESFIFTDALGREHSGQSGDYLVHSSDGVRRIVSQALFEDIYVPLVEKVSAPGAFIRPVSRAAPEPRIHAHAEG